MHGDKSKHSLHIHNTVKINEEKATMNLLRLPYDQTRQPVEALSVPFTEQLIISDTLN